MVLASLGMDSDSGWCNQSVYVVFRIVMSRVEVVALAPFLLAFLVAAAVVGQALEPVLSGEDRIEVVSPAGVATFEGELRRPR